MVSLIALWMQAWNERQFGYSVLCRQAGGTLRWDDARCLNANWCPPGTRGLLLGSGSSRETHIQGEADTAS